MSCSLLPLGLGEVLPQEVRRAGLDGHAVGRQRLDGVGLHGACEALVGRLAAGDDGQAELILQKD